MRHSGARARVLAALGGLQILLVPATGMAQAPTQPSEPAPGLIEIPGEAESSETTESIEEIVIQGRAADTELLEEPVSSVQFGATDIKNLRIQNVADLSAYTPNLEINTAFAATNPTLFIRGVGLKDYNSNSAGAVGIWQDGIMKNSPSAQLFSLYDVDSIEVLRGPLGAIGGRNSTAGAIRIHSRKPNGEWTSNTSFTYGNLNNIMFEGGVGFPIFPETLDERLSGRISFVTEFRDGYTKNKCANWDPSKHGLLTSTEDEIRAFYNRLGPSSTPVLTSLGTSDTPTSVRPRFIYQNPAAIGQYNNDPNQSGLNRARLLDGPGGTPGTEIALQANAFSIAPDNACLLRSAGALTTARGANPQRPEGAFRANVDAFPLSRFQGLQSKYNDIEYYGARMQLRFQPTETLDFLASAHWGANRGDSFHLQSVGAEPAPINDLGQVITKPPGFFQSANSSGWSETLRDFSPFEKPTKRDGLRFTRGAGGEDGLPGFAGDDVYSGFYSSDGDEKLDLFGVHLNSTYEPSWGRVVFVSGYEENQRKIEDEGDGCPCTPLEAVLDDESWQVTQDVRIEGGGEGYTWMVGGFFIHEKLESNNDFSTNGNRFLIKQEYEQITDGWNVGADFHYDFLEEGSTPWLYQISLDVGARYNWERKDFQLGTRFLRLQQGSQVDTIPETSVDDTWQDPTGEVVVSYKPVEDARIYAKFTRGFKVGHFNAGITVNPGGEDAVLQSLDPVDPERIDAVEVGFRATLWDGRIQLSGALFRYWYDELQVFDIVNEAGAVPTNQLLNADADVLGAELDLTFRPLEGLLIQGGAGWIDSEFGSFKVNKTVIPPRGMGGGGGENGTFNYEGNPLIAAPEWSLTGYIEYELPLQGWGSLVPSFDFSYKSRTYLDPQKEELLSQPAYWLFNGRLAYNTPGGTIEIAGWVQNIFDKQYRIDAFDVSREFQQVLEVWSPPRTYGVTISHTW